MIPLPQRPRIRRRVGAFRLGAVAGDATAAASFLLLLLLLGSPPPGVLAYMGPTHCTKQGVTAAAAVRSPRASEKGYATFNHLLFDMVSLSSSFESGMEVPEDRLTFSICPGTVIDLDDTSLPLGFLPIKVPRLTLQCGRLGRRGSGPDDSCVIRGGGKRDPSAPEWNTSPQKSYKTSAAGILGGGGVAQVYVYGESAYEVTLRGLTFDNSITKREVQIYSDFVAQFGSEALGGDDEGFAVDGSAGGGGGEKIREQYDASVPVNQDGGGRRLEGDFQGEVADGDIKPAHRFASVAVRGKGYGDDAGPRLVTIEDCRFESHRGYAVLVSPGIQEPEMPATPRFDFPNPIPGSILEGDKDGDGNNSVNLQSSGQIYNGGKTNNVGGSTGAAEGTGPSSQMINGGENSNTDQQADLSFLSGLPGGNNGGRRLNLLENGGKYIPADGLVSYYDHAAGRNYLDGRRVKMSGTEFVGNIVAGDSVAGLVTSAYSLTMTDCFFRKNDAKAMVFVYNNEALVDNTVFAENRVEVSTVIMASPKGAAPIVDAAKGDLTGVEPTHVVERTCFLGSQVGMSNVLVTDVENTGFGQRDNHATGTQFTWVSACEGGAAEQFGNDCLETGRCDGTCVQFTSERCMADRLTSPEYDQFFNAGNRNVRNTWFMTMTIAVAVMIGANVIF